jgi:hypothetical protein
VVCVGEALAGRADPVARSDLLSAADRKELIGVAKMRQRTARSVTAAQAAELRANVEAQLQNAFSFDDDAVWEQATEAAEKAIEIANREVAARCRELGIPAKFAPSIEIGWRRGGGSYLIREEKDAIRRLADKRIIAMEQRAKAQIDVAVDNTIAQLVQHGLESDTALRLLEEIPTVQQLMPRFDIKELHDRSGVPNLPNPYRSGVPNIPGPERRPLIEAPLPRLAPPTKLKRRPIT